ncbi:hypothetical protein BX070DRAFT_258071 [Coemansia spiralis]|nr:hypothetical protein BX070DRAFT_258071 [Coemansia spiralis]
MSLYRILPTLVSRNAGGRALRAPRSLKPLCQCKLAKRSFTTCGAIRKDKDPKDEVDNEWNRSIEEAIERAKREVEKQKPNQPDNKKDENDFMTNLGQVMIQLPKQLEGFFELGLSGGIYTESVKFVERAHSGMQLSGKSQYLGVAKVLRIAMNAYFAHPSLTIVSLRQVAVSSPESNADEANDSKSYDVFVRWVFEGIPRHTEIIGGHGSRYEGEFRYHIDRKSGLVALHEVTAIHPAPPTKFLATTGLARWAGWAAPKGSLSLAKAKPSHVSCIVPAFVCQRIRRDRKQDEWNKKGH